MSRSSKVSLCMMLVVCAIWAPSASAASAAQITAAIQNGLAALATEQLSVGCGGGGLASGCWTFGGYYAAPTGSAVYAFLNSKSSWPGAQTAAYNTIVTNGINYLLSVAATATVSTRDDGVNICPGGSGSCTAVYWPGEGEQTYSTGLVIGAIDDYAASVGPTTVATTTGPLAGMTWVQIAQGVTNMFAVGQSTTHDSGYGYYGGWRYYFPSNGDSDMSTTQWAVFAFIYDQSIGAQNPPGSTVTLLQHWLTTDQVTTAGSTFGGACYTPPTGGVCGGVAIPTFSETGGWLLSAIWAGDAATSAPVQNAIAWENANWQQADSGWNGNFGYPYAMLATYKGLSASLGTTTTSGITNGNLLSPTCSGAGPNGITGGAPASACNWYQDYEQWLVTNQCGTQSGCGGLPAGAWAGGFEWGDPLSTAMDIAILTATIVPVAPVVSTTPIPTSWMLAALGLLMLVIWRVMAVRRRSDA